MRPVHPLGPVGLLLITTVAVGWLARHAWNLSAETEALRVASTEAAKADPCVPAAGSASAEGAPAGLRIEELRAQTEREVAMREAAEKRIELLQRRLPTQRGEVLASFGRIDQMGQRAAKCVVAMAAAAATKKPRSESSPEDPAEVEMWTSFLADIGVISELEKEPGEIARFQVESLRVLLGLDAPTIQRVQAFLLREFSRLQTLSLTANFRPAEGFADFDARRDAAILEIAARLRPLLPGNDPKLALLPGVLSLGGGFRTEVKVGPDGHGTVDMRLPLFPANVFF
jgi:hypothetical protein